MPHEFTLAAARAARTTIHGHVEALRSAQTALCARQQPLHAPDRRHRNSSARSTRERRERRDGAPSARSAVL